MGYNTKNYTEQGGDKTVIGGELAVTAEGKITFGGAELKPAAFQADSTAVDVADLVADFNALLLKLKTAGLMESE
ncbi:head fiber protein [Clostridiisalibacter paucivorans]|uniref:head fiber protein n=1 Tax=Clostridiisalibacter paucivorans TaxID=408753 RepID=UPI00047B23E0|nr:head fiber protein [Clostridiisalibacter paucivorans]